MKGIEIRQRGKKTYQKEEYLLAQVGKFDLERMKWEELTIEREVPKCAAFLQIKQKLYVAGGVSDDYEEEHLSAFFFLDYSGKCSSLGSLNR